MFNVVLYKPEIPPNTGNIGRLTLGSGCKLSIVGEPLFELDNDSAVKRAGLDYWENVELQQYDDWTTYIDSDSPKSRFLITKFADRPYHSAEFYPGDHLIFGGETRGVPDSIQNSSTVKPICIPMKNEVRSYNLANSVAVVLFEALRQVNPDWFNNTPYSRG